MWVIHEPMVMMATAVCHSRLGGPYGMPLLWQGRHYGIMGNSALLTTQLTSQDDRRIGLKHGKTANLESTSSTMCPIVGSRA